MHYHMHIKDSKAITVYNPDLRKDIKIEVGCEYVFDPGEARNKKDRKNKGRIVEILGFSSDWMSDAIVRYKDSKRRGRLKPCELVPVDAIADRN